MKQYLDLVSRVLTDGEHRSDRTGVGTISIFGEQVRYDLREGFPLLTTKRVMFESVVKELLWFLRGETNINTLGCGIWDEWADADGELGPIYGAQWRRWERMRAHVDSYGDVSCRVQYVDQIFEAARLILTEPSSRRIIVSAWNVSDLPNMKLSPCHAMFQLYVSGQWLDLQLYQRSADLALGVPFNIASYALLLTMFAAYTGLRPRYFIHTFGDLHIYSNHVEGLRRQLERTPRPLPELILRRTPELASPAAATMVVDDFELVGYDPHPFIKFPIAV